MIMQVHDELVFEVKSSAVKEFTHLVQTAMSQAWKLSVPLIAAIGVGNNWDEAH